LYPRQFSFNYAQLGSELYTMFPTLAWHSMGVSTLQSSLYNHLSLYEAVTFCWHWFVKFSPLMKSFSCISFLFSCCHL
jgi:hypothetical protein